MDQSRRVRVAVAIILNAQGQILLSKRHANVHQGGLWEFPGGKCEPRESFADALIREIDEELGLAVLASQPVMEIEHDYGDKLVLLGVRRVDQFTGEPCAREGQALQWVLREQLRGYEFPAANQSILEYLESSEF
ncbi:MAG: 8-oxo-dGTP diphosphatase MutT [Pseudomonadota bacterium]